LQYNGGDVASRTIRAQLLAAAAALTLAGAAGAQAAGPWTPPRFESGALPATPVEAVGGGEVLIECAVGTDGRPSDLKVLRTTPPFTAAALTAIGSWRFHPAEAVVRGRDGRERPASVASRILVAYFSHPPTLTGPTLGEPPRDVAVASPEVAFPAATALADYPPRALDAASVLVELDVDASGEVADAVIRRSVPGFDQTALAAARRWHFRPARIDGSPEATRVYVVFSWRPPVTVTPFHR
jgi:TonB family protein